MANVDPATGKYGEAILELLRALDHEDRRANRAICALNEALKS